MSAIVSAGTLRLVNAFWQICLLRRAPQDLPASQFLLRLITVVFVLRGAAINAFSFDVGEAIALNVIMTVVLFAALGFLLALRGFGPRFSQTATAMMGTTIVLFPAALALRYWFHVIEHSGTTSNLAGHCWVVLFVWELFIAAHILRHALEMRLIAGFFIAIAYVLLEFQVMYVAHRALTPLFA